MPAISSFPGAFGYGRGQPPASGGSGIITNGLVIQLDASNSSSYPGTGTTWFDITSTNNGSLINTPTFTNTDPKYFTFDGVDDYAQFPATSTGATTNSSSIGLWVNTPSFTSQNIYVNLGPIYIGQTSSVSNRFTVYIATSLPTPAQTIYATSTGTTYSTNTWYNVYAVWDEGTDLKIYVNGSLNITHSITGTGLNVGPTNTGWYIGASPPPTSSINFKIGEFITYNRVLNSTEILNNFNSRKTLYGY